LEKDKDKRYQSAAEVRSELMNIEKGIPTTERVIPERKPLTSREITVTFGLRKLFVPALVFIGIVIIGVIVWQLLPQKEVVSAPKIENSIAVISFNNQTGDRAYDYLQDAIPNLLITNLEQSGSLYVATWERMRDLLKQMGKKDIEVIDRDLGFELCRREGIEAIVLGSFIKAGDIFATDIKVLDVETKKLLKSSSSKGRGIGSILESQIDDLSREISEDIFLQKIEASQLKIRNVTTDSMEAYKYFLMGREAYWKVYLEDALEPFKKAVEIDPNFAEAYYYLADTCDFLGHIKERDEAIEKAKSLSKELTEKERLYIDEMYARYIEHDQEKGKQILEQLVEKYPKEKYAHYHLGSYYQASNPEKAIEEYNKALELDPNFGSALNRLGYFYTNMENYEKAVESFKRYAEIAPGEANPLDSLADTYYFMGNLDEAILKSMEALEIKPDFYLTYTKIGCLYALKENYTETMKWVDKFIAETPILSSKCDGYLWKGFYSYWLGSLKNCLISLERAEEMAKNAGDEYRMAVVECLKGAIYYDRGELDLSSKYHQNWLEAFNKTYPESEPFSRSFHSFNLGLIDLKNGKIDAAKTRLTEMRSFFSEMSIILRKWAKYWNNLLEIEILLTEGLSEKAINAFVKEFLPRSPVPQSTNFMILSNTPFNRDVIARAYLRNGDFDNAIAEYKRLTTFDPSSRDRRLINPKYYYRLAKLYEQKGAKTKAIENYDKFLSLWKDADPGIDEVDDARERLAALTK
jgi:tetratricopeptide (TPR) repeat protein